MTKHRYTQSKPPVLAAEATEVSVDTDDPVGSESLLGRELTPKESTEIQSEPMPKAIVDSKVPTDSASISGRKLTLEEIGKREHLKFCDELISADKAIPVDYKTVEVDTNEILVAILDQFKRINSVLEKQSQAQIQQAATLMQLTDGIKTINDRLKKPSFM